MSFESWKAIAAGSWLLVLAVSVFPTSALAQSNPVPFVNQPLVPDSAMPGGQAFMLTVNGTGFVQGSTVAWNSIPLSTKFVSSSQLTADVPAANIALATTASVTVVNPAPGGGTSNVGLFVVRQPFNAVSFSNKTTSPKTLFSVIATTDLNHDGKPDLVSTVTNTPRIASFLGKGDGTFTFVSEYRAGEVPTIPVAGDFNGDGNPDVAVLGSRLIAILLGNGDGTFQPEQDITITNDFVGLAGVAADLNGDGKLDLIANDVGRNKVVVFLGKGDGTFQDPSYLSAGNEVTYGLAVGDFNGDGKLDLAVTAKNDNVINVLLGNGDGSFQSSVAYPTAIEPQTLITSDLNGDGILDLVAECTSDGEHGNISVLLGNGDGTFQERKDHRTLDQGLGVVAGDLNGDNEMDLVVGYFSSGTNGGRLFSVFLGNGDGTFRGNNVYHLPSPIPVVADFDGDGKLDVATAGQGLTVALSSTSVLSRTIVGFGTVKVGSSATAKVTLSNIGSDPFGINGITVGGPDAQQFTQGNNCQKSLAAGAHCTINLTFKPQGGIPYNAMVKVNDTAASPAQTIYLQGIGQN